jgi:hypothetical protein
MQIIKVLLKSVAGRINGAREALLSFFEKIGQGIVAYECSRFGICTTGLTAEEALALKSLFPAAKTMVVFGDPFHAFENYSTGRSSSKTLAFAYEWHQSVSELISAVEKLEAIAVSEREFKDKIEQISLHLELQLDQTNLRFPETPSRVKLQDIDVIELDRVFRSLKSNWAFRYRVEPIPEAENSSDKVVKAQDRGDERRESARNGQCVVLVPAISHVETPCELALRELEHRGYVVRRVFGISAIDQARNEMASDALRDGFDETLWIDSDISFEPDDVERLRQHDCDVVCAIYPQKAKRALSCHALPSASEFRFGTKGGLVEVLYAATGFLLVRRGVYLTVQKQLQLPLCNERFGKSLVPYFQPTILQEADGYWYLAEDFAFCDRVRRCGFSIYADTRIRLQHIGKYGYSWEDAGGTLERFDSYRFILQ